MQERGGITKLHRSDHLYGCVCIRLGSGRFTDSPSDAYHCDGTTTAVHIKPGYRAMSQGTTALEVGWPSWRYYCLRPAFV